MKEPSDFTKEAGLQQLLGSAGNFINNMPNNPTWQNILAGGGSLALPLLLINLLSGRSPLRGLLPALLLGGALGGGLPAAFNYMNGRGMFGRAGTQPQKSPYSMDNVPDADYGPPGPGQYWDENNRIRTVETPVDKLNKERMADSTPGTLGHWGNRMLNKADQFAWDFHAPTRGMVSTFETVKKNGLPSLRIDQNPFADPWKTPFNHGVKPTATPGG